MYKYISTFAVFRIKEADAEKLNGEYQRLVEGLRDANVARDTDMTMSNPSRNILYK